MGLQTTLYQQHLAAGGQCVDFAGWDMPLNYGSQLDEHHIVRQDAGMFDVSHMTVIDVNGEQAQTYLKNLLANNVDKLTFAGKALYTCMLNQTGGVIDDLIVYYLAPNQYRLVTNAGTRAKDLAWLQQQAQPYSVRITERPDFSMLAIQGPKAREKTYQALSSNQAQAASELKPFSGIMSENFFIARTGYTGEDGFEILLPHEAAESFWQKLANNGVKPCGLGARDTLRLEAGMNLYGHDMDEDTSPLVSGLSWTVAFEPEARNFIGREALVEQKSQGLKQKLVGLVLQKRGVLRDGQVVKLDDGSEGIITSGGFSPALQTGIALARVPVNCGSEANVIIRNKPATVTVIKPPFVRNGKQVFNS